ncbi:hypothetical protein [Streptacidiphilus jeojiense]|uniref:hypothetical protein n=1 Tax=Streptacidiphilus jeojiense TaxID=436229 RepID=UPI001E2FE89A|nr:hypothetical protein [Streptacidiphilus jeojiense]
MEIKAGSDLSYALTSRAQNWAREARRPVVALHERAGAMVTNGQLTAVGFEPVHLVEKAILTRND